MAETREVRSPIRCPRCGGLNPSDADWCGQCLKRFTAPEPPPPAPVSPAEPTPVPAGPPPEAAVPQNASTLEARVWTEEPADDDGDEPDEDVQEAVERGAFLVAGEKISWKCGRCHEPNPMDMSFCATCGAPFAETIREKDKAVLKQRDPGTVAAMSLLFPGLGHAYLGDTGGAIGRAIMSLWVLGIAAALAVQEDLPGGMMIASVFAFAAFGLWLAAAHDSYRLAQGDAGMSIIKGRAFLYITMALLGILLIGLFAAAFSAR